MEIKLTTAEAAEWVARTQSIHSAQLEARPFVQNNRQLEQQMQANNAEINKCNEVIGTHSKARDELVAAILKKHKVKGVDPAKLDFSGIDMVAMEGVVVVPDEE